MNRRNELGATVMIGTTVVILMYIAYVWAYF